MKERVQDEKKGTEVRFQGAGKRGQGTVFMVQEMKGTGCSNQGAEKTDKFQIDF